jgi:hypothetical protein
MTALGADYSYARPGGAALVRAGVKGVGRYLATDGRGLTASEYQDLKSHGLLVWVVREGAASGMLGGFAQGVIDARIAAQQIAAVGLPADTVVHTAADWNVQSSQFAACDAYHDGFASVLGGYDRVGAYGGLHWLNHVHSVGKAVSFWQAGATSWNHGEAAQMPIQFEQTTATPPLPGTDHNYIHDAGMAFLNATPITIAAAKEEDYSMTQGAYFRLNDGQPPIGSIGAGTILAQENPGEPLYPLSGPEWAALEANKNAFVNLSTQDMTAVINKVGLYDTDPTTHRRVPAVAGRASFAGFSVYLP